MNTSKKVSPIVRDFSAIDATESELKIMHTTRNKQHRKLASTILARKGKNLKKADILPECDRLIDVAKKVVKESGYKVTNTHEMKNCWKAVKDTIRQRLTVAIAPDTVITAIAGKDSKGNVVTDKVKVKDLPESARALATNASELKATLDPDSTDKRKTNGKKADPAKRKAQQIASVPQKHSNDVTAKDWTMSMNLALKQVKTAKLLLTGIIAHKVKIIEIAKSMGYDITVTPVKK